MRENTDKCGHKSPVTFTNLFVVAPITIDLRIQRVKRSPYHKDVVTVPYKRHGIRDHIPRRNHINESC